MVDVAFKIGTPPDPESITGVPKSTAEPPAPIDPARIVGPIPADALVVFVEQNVDVTVDRVAVEVEWCTEDVVVVGTDGTTRVVDVGDTVDFG